MIKAKRYPRQTQQLRVEVHIYERLVKHAEETRVCYLDFMGVLLAAWSLANPTLKANAIHLQAKWKADELAKLIPTTYKQRSSKK